VAKRKNLNHEFSTGQRRVALTRVYLKMTCPDSDPSTRAMLADSILALLDSEGRTTPKRSISDPEAVEMVWRQSQCVLNQTGRCPLLIFGRQLAEEINGFFGEEECLP
jgi:hypothetical protein